MSNKKSLSIKNEKREEVKLCKPVKILINIRLTYSSSLFGNEKKSFLTILTN